MEKHSDKIETIITILKEKLKDYFDRNAFTPIPLGVNINEWQKSLVNNIIDDINKTHLSIFKLSHIEKIKTYDINSFEFELINLKTNVRFYYN